MKKFKYLFITLFFMVFFIGTANADTCYTNYNANWTDNTGFTISTNASYFITDNIKFNNNINIGNTYDYIKIPLYIVSLSTNNVISNINLYETCTNAANVFDRYTITYQDGSTASIDAQNYRTICNQYKTNGTAVLPYQPYITSIKVRLNYNNKATYCEVDSNLNATCRIPKETDNFVVSSYQVSFSLNGNSSIVKGGIISGYVSYCKDSSEEIKGDVNTIKNKLEQNNQTQQQIQNNTNEIKNDIKSTNTSGSESAADDLKNNSAFQDNSGLSSVVSMPLTFVNSLSNTCQPISLNIPYFDVDIQIPCLQSIITDKMPALANILKVVINGFIIYRVLLDIFQIIRNAKNPEDDRIEVLDL